MQHNKQLRWFIGTLGLGCVGLIIACVDYNPAFESSFLSGGTGEDTSSATDFTACSNPDDVEILVQDRAFIPQCGCISESDKTCTVKVGSKVTWRFLDADEHNVTSVPETFGASADLPAGRTFEATFDDAGEYPYGCTIHAEMRGYTIVAE